MKKLTYTLVLPISIISIFCFTKVWFTLPDDAPDTILRGFPIPFNSDGWHTSGAIYFYVLEFLFDFSVYFAFWWIVFFLINKFIVTVKIHRIISIALLIVSFFLTLIFVLFTFMYDNRIYLKRDFKYQLLDTRYEFIWENNPRFELKNYEYKK